MLKNFLIVYQLNSSVLKCTEEFLRFVHVLALDGINLGGHDLYGHFSLNIP